MFGVNRSALAIFLGLAGAGAMAEPPAQQAGAVRAMEVSQFGMTPDAKFIFCSGDDCPERSSKTVAGPKPVPAVAAARPVLPALLSQPASSQPVPQLSQAKTKAAKKVKKPAVRKKKRPAQLGCGPDETRK